MKLTLVTLEKGGITAIGAEVGGRRVPQHRVNLLQICTLATWLHKCDGKKGCLQVAVKQAVEQSKAAPGGSSGMLLLRGILLCQSLPEEAMLAFDPVGFFRVSHGYRSCAAAEHYPGQGKPPCKDGSQFI